MKEYPRIEVYQKIILVVISLVLFVGFTLPAMSLPPKMEADRLLLSAETKLNKKDYVAAGLDLEKIRALNIKLPVDYYYQYGRYLGMSKQAAEAKKNLEIYLDKAQKEGKYYNSALKWYTYVKENEEKWSEENKAAVARKARFKDNGDGTVTDQRSGLMWAAKDNGEYIPWSRAKAYCENYTGGGYSDWRLPTQDELAGLYDKNFRNKDGYYLTDLIHLSSCCAWISEKREIGSSAFHFDFYGGRRGWCDASHSFYPRALPVRSVK